MNEKVEGGKGSTADALEGSLGALESLWIGPDQRLPTTCHLRHPERGGSLQVSQKTSREGLLLTLTTAVTLGVLEVMPRAESVAAGAAWLLPAAEEKIPFRSGTLAVWPTCVPAPGSHPGGGLTCASLHTLLLCAHPPRLVRNTVTVIGRTCFVPNKHASEPSIWALPGSLTRVQSRNFPPPAP